MPDLGKAVPAAAGATDDLVVLAQLVAAAGGATLPADLAALWKVIAAGKPALDFAKLGQMTFRAPDLIRYPALRLAHEVMVAGGLSGAAFNAAKEVALDQFIAGSLGFAQMSHLVEASLSALWAQFGPTDAIPTLEDVLAMD